MNYSPILRPEAIVGTESESLRFGIAESTFGSILVAATDRGVRVIFIGSRPERLLADLHRHFPAAAISEGGEDFRPLLSAVVDFVENPAQPRAFALDVRGSDFQHKVWRALQDIPAGATASYSEIAARVGAPREAYAVGEACAANLIAVAIPCHRVVRKDGSLSGYRWGIARKRVLLEREGAR